MIWLSGPTGAGKTSVARLLRKVGYSIVEEKIPEKLFKRFAAEPTTNCEPLQRKLMQARLPVAYKFWMVTRQFRCGRAG
jgi:RNase adaptor protein for sRNA GlmZ degradation